MQHAQKYNPSKAGSGNPPASSLYLYRVKILDYPVPLAAPAWLALAVVTLSSSVVSPFFPNWGNGMLCLLLGLVLRNVWVTPWQKPGNAAVLRWNEKNMLAWATILLGFELQTHFLAGIPLVYLPALVLSVLGAVLTGEWLARRSTGPSTKDRLTSNTSLSSTYGSRFPATQARLLGAGNAICGNSAIAAVHPLLSASPAQIAISVTLINALGLLGTLFLGPGTSLMGFGPREQAVLMGSLLQSVGHVSAATSGLEEEPALLAMSLKMGRILLLIPLLLWFHSLSQRSKFSTRNTILNIPNLRSLIYEVPFYVWGFMICALATNLLPIPANVLSIIKTINQWMLWVALAAIGMNIHLQTILRQGREALFPALGMFLLQILLVVGWLTLLK